MGIKNKNIEGFYPLSPMQQGILFHSLADSESGVYFNQTSYNIKGTFNAKAFRHAWQKVVERYSILRSGFVWSDLKEPVQVVQRQVNLPWQEHDWQHLSLKEQQQKFQFFLQSDRASGFELKQAPLMRLTLIYLSNNFYNFTWSHHHILLDGWSVASIFKEVIACYKAFSNEGEISLESVRPYRDYIVWLQQQDLSQAETFWRQTLKGFTSPTQLSVGKEASLRTQMGEHNEKKLNLSRTTTAALQSIAKQNHLTLNTLVQGAWALLLSRYSGQEDVVFGAVTSGRPPTLAGAESMVGLFINTTPIRVKVSPEELLLPWLHKIRDFWIEARQYEYCPLVKVQGWSEIPKGFSLFESLVIFENYAVDPSVREKNINFEIEICHHLERNNYPITLFVLPNEELLFKIVSNNSDRFDNGTITRMLGHLQTLLEDMVTNEQQHLGDFSLLTEPEQQQLLIEWNDTEVDYPQDKCIHQLFEAQVEKTPDTVAVVFENQQLTYCELNARANQLAHYLQQLGVKPEIKVGICVERSLEMVIGLLAILKSGGAYVPLDPAYPKEQLAFMLEDTQVSVLFTQQRLVDQLPEHRARVVCLDQDWKDIAHASQENLASGVTMDNLAYVIYTSGSTGKPKGIGLPQRSLVNLLQWHFSSLLSGVRTLQFAPLSFDASFHEIFATWGSGGTLFILPENLRTDAVGLGRFVWEQAIEKIILPVAVLQLLAESVVEPDITPLHIGLLNTLREITTTGEKLQITQPIIKLFKSLKHCSLHNHYGLSETHVVTASILGKNPDEWSFYPPIGQPIANTQIHIVDRQFNIVPVGVTGELYIGGVSLAQGYLNWPDLTAEKFIPNPFSKKPGARLYKTGDLARYLPNGNIEYIGRIDHQVKVRGFRIELGEIEAVLSQHKAIKEVIVTDHRDEAGNKQLVAYVVSDQESTSISGELRSLLNEKLPTYMVPSAFVFLRTLPLTSNGKVDRRALPLPNLTRPELEKTFVAPRTTTEEALTEIWKQVLGIEKIGIHDNFFELGGDSLLVTQLVAKLVKTLELEVSVFDLFEASTVAALAERIEKMQTLEKISALAKMNEEREEIEI